MRNRKPSFGLLLLAGFTALFLLTALAVTRIGAEETADFGVEPEWVRALPAKTCPGGSNTNCHRASPLVADLTGDGNLEIVVATNNGHVLAYRHNGSLLWKVDTGPLFGMGSGKQEITASPAAADIDRDGKLEVVVATGTIRPTVCTRGGVIVLDHDGRVEPGWPFLAKDIAVPPSGCPDTVYSTPALGDLDKDGDLEIVFGSFDHAIYALHHNGQMVSGFTPDSYHYPRFGWPELKGRTADTIWSSAALDDINNDGYLDIVIGTDEGNYDASHSPAQGDWVCPYSEPLKDGYCGGSIYALDRQGRLLDGFPRYKYEIIQSTPAIVDLEGDGQSEIFVGTGSWYYRQSSDHPTLGFRLYGLNSKGADLPGWQGGKTVGGFIAGSPSVGDITGDGKPNIVAAASDKRLYAWHLNGQLVSGFPMTPRTHWGDAIDLYNVGTGIILADYTGDEKMEIFLRSAWEITIINGRGQLLTAPNPTDSRPYYSAAGGLTNNPAVADLDGDGHLELVAHNSNLIVWELPAATTAAQWPMFKSNAARTSLLEPTAWAEPAELNLISERGDEENQRLHLYLHSDFGVMDWRAGTNQPARIRFSASSGVVDGQTFILVDIRVPSGLTSGVSHLGDIHVTFTRGDDYEKTETIPVNVQVINRMQQQYLPMVR